MSSRPKGDYRATLAGKTWPEGYSLAMGLDTGPVMTVTVTFGSGVGAVIDIEEMDPKAESLNILWQGESVYQSKKSTDLPPGDIDVDFLPVLPHVFMGLVRRKGWTHPDVYAGAWIGSPTCGVTQTLRRVSKGG